MENELEKMFTPEQVAEQFGLTPRTIKDWMRTGKLKGVKFGKSWRIKENDLKEFMSKGSE